ncbi:MAG: ECF transporter S component [Clostridia bacterium]|nr:ECF transporter S component [Clostridia bacterium]
MKHQSLVKVVLSAMLAALVCVATMNITVPSPLGGFLNLGDGFVLLAGWLLGPFYGFLAAGLGSALADLFLGYAFYVPGTFLIKGVSALLCALLIRALSRSVRVRPILWVGAGLVAEIEMVAGYFVYSAILGGEGWGAIVSVPGNLVQGIAGICLFTVLAAVFKKYRLTRIFDTHNKD